MGTLTKSTFTSRPISHLGQINRGRHRKQAQTLPETQASCPRPQRPCHWKDIGRRTSAVEAEALMQTVTPSLQHVVSTLEHLKTEQTNDQHQYLFSTHGNMRCIENRTWKTEHALQEIAS